MMNRGFHLCAGIGLLLATVGAAVSGCYSVALFFGLGAVMALCHWKAVKAGIIE